MKLTSPNLKLLGSYLEAWNTHDVARVLTFFVPDSVCEDTALAKSFVGHAALRTFLEDMFRAYPDASFELHAAFDSGNCVSWEWTMHGHFTGTGKSRLPAKEADHRLARRVVHRTAGRIDSLQSRLLGHGRLDEATCTEGRGASDLNCICRPTRPGPGTDLTRRAPCN